MRRDSPARAPRALQPIMIQHTDDTIRLPIDKIIEWLRGEKHVIRGAPFSFILFLLIGGLLGKWIATQYYSGQLGAAKEQINTLNAQLKAKDDELGRYRVVLGISPASPGALVELDNQVLALRAQFIVGKLRERDSALNAKYAEIKGQLDAKKIDQDQANKAHIAALKEASQDFDNNLASDTYNVENELRTRLDASALSHIINPGFVANGDPYTRITFPQMFRGLGFFEIAWLNRLADEIDQMAKLLPPDSGKPKTPKNK
jgi:hypothetical protein